MKSITITLPETIDRSPEEIKIIIAAKLYGYGMLSLGEGAEVAGLSRRAFIEILGKYGVSVFNYDVEELEEDVKNA